MLGQFYPDEEIPSVYQVDYKELYELGYRAFLYDIDNTLVRHDAGAVEEAKALCENIHSLGMRICLISNNHLERVQSFSEEIGADYFSYDSHKPSIKAYVKAAEWLELPKKRLMFFGDQLFTDVWGAKRAGIYSVLVKPIGREKLLRIKLKRILEQPILWLYRRQSGKERRIPLLSEREDSR